MKGWMEDGIDCYTNMVDRLPAFWEWLGMDGMDI